MTVPSKSWSVIADGQVDADSPLDTTLITALRDNLVHLEEWLGDGYTAAKDHNHDGVSSSLIAGGAIDTTIQSTGSQNISSASSWTPAAGVYQMADADSSYPKRMEINDSGTWRVCGPTTTGAFGGVGYFDGTNMRIYNAGAGTATVYWQKF